MAGDATFDDINETKANMDHIYDQADPRAYFRELKVLGYAIPDAAKPIFQKLFRSSPISAADPASRFLLLKIWPAEFRHPSRCSRTRT